MNNSINVVITATYALFITAATAFAQCTIVAAPGGSDANPGTLAAPLATPNAAVKKASAGGVVCLRNGTYPLTLAVIADKPVTIQSYPGEWAVLTADASDASRAGEIILVGASDVTIQDIELSGAHSYGVHVSGYVLGVPPANTKILRTKIHHSGYLGIKVDQSDNVQVLDSEVYATGSRIAGGGIDVIASIPSAANPSGPGATVRGNYVHDMPSAAIVMKGGTIRGIAENNRVERIAGGGIYAGGDTGGPYFRGTAVSECIDCVVRNNIVTETDAMGIGCWGAQGAQILNNTVVNAARTVQAAFFAVPDGIGLRCTAATVQNNVFVTSGAGRMMHVVNPGSGMVIDNNLYFNVLGNYAMWWESSAVTGYWGNLASWLSFTGNDRHSVAYQNPMIDPATFKPLFGSPLIDSGVTLANVPTDFVGVSRPQGAAFDKGAFEVPSSSAPVLSLLSVVSGGGQSAAVGSVFPAPLIVRATDAAGRGVPGVIVFFTAPTSGPGATFGGAPSRGVTTDANGQASSGAVTANSYAGNYAVSVSLGPLSPVAIPLQNVAQTPAPPTLAPTSIVLSSGGTVSMTARSFPITAFVTSNGGPVYTGTVQFFVSGSLAGVAQNLGGKFGWNMPIPAGIGPGTELSVYAAFGATSKYAASRSATITIRVQ